jgi:hypothetical protein
MGTDIYGLCVRKTKDGKVYREELEWDFARCYPLFAFLADVRNSGTYNITPMLDSPNGLPDFVEPINTKPEVNKPNDECLYLNVQSIGDWGYSHLNLDDILNYDISDMSVYSTEYEYIPLSDLFIIKDFFKHLEAVRCNNDDDVYFIFGFDS